MADKAENENQGIPAGGERRAALRSDESGGGSTRVRESGFPMRKASTLPDVSAYSASGGGTPLGNTSTGAASGGTTPTTGSFRTTAPNDVLSEQSRNDIQQPGDTEGAVAPGEPTGNDEPAGPSDADKPVVTGTGQTAGQAEPHVEGAEDRSATNFSSPATQQITTASAASSTTADPSSPATSQIAATPADSTPVGSIQSDSAQPGSTEHSGTQSNATAPAASAATVGATAVGATAVGATAAGATAAGATSSRSTESRANRTNPDDATPDTSSLSIRPPEEDVSRRASQRDEAAAAKPLLPRVFQVMVAVFFPVILLAAAIRAVTTPLFLWVEYHRPGFPADSYGYSTEDRMTYGSYAMDYILNWAPARYLGDLVNTDGDQLFLDSEVGHMADVKGVLSTGFVVATVLALLAIAACVYLARRYPGGIRRALFAGAVATLVLATALAVAGILAWETFFTQVHALFFADGTWTFRLDDTLIQLFPAQFWIDAAATVGAIVLIGSVLTLVLTWPTKARREKSARAYEARRANSGI